MNSPNNTRLIVTKTVLWMLVGCAFAVVLARYVRGLGATTALTDVNPWGMWIGFDVLSGVALAAGGFVIAATVYIFRLEKYHALVRPAVLTAFLGYVAVALGLMVDLGRPWNIWRMIFFWQPHSPLFEVGWCVMLYLNVLALEFAPVVFQGLKMNRAFMFMKRLTLPLVIAGIALSTLHQSSLGTLFLLAEDRMHPLWYSPIQPLIFFISAIGLGLAMVTFESSVTSWLYRREGEWKVLGGLTRAAALVLSLYFVIRIGDLLWRGELARVLDGGWISALFVFELALSTIVPIILFTLPAVRGKSWAVFTGATCGVAGFILHRADVGGISHIPITGQSYLPALTEVVVSVGLVSAMALIFLFFIEKLPVWEEAPATRGHFTPPMTDPLSGSIFGGYWFGRSHLAAVAAVVGVVLGVVLLEVTQADGAEPIRQEVRSTRTVAVERVPASTTGVSKLALVESHAPQPEGRVEIMSALLIDGDRAGTSVLFNHKDHQGRLGGEASCGKCHHRNFRLDRATPCSACHRDMYRATDVFQHDQHVQKLKGNASCVRCHVDPGLGKSRDTATECAECHSKETSTEFVVNPSDGVVRGMAPGYREAMHSLCISCHLEHEQTVQVAEPRLSRCGNCHAPGEVNVADEVMPSRDLIASVVEVP